VEEIKKVLENEADVLFAYLFGSYARETQGKRSDIDIAIYLREVNILETDPLYPSRLAIRIENALTGKTPVDVRVLNGSTIRFRSQVLRYGKLLFSRDERKRIEFETSSMSYYYDFKPFLDVYDAARKARLGV
jgi:hypothetical protein